VNEYTPVPDGPYAAFVETTISYDKSVFSNLNRDLRSFSIEINKKNISFCYAMIR